MLNSYKYKYLYTYQHEYYHKRRRYYLPFFYLGDYLNFSDRYYGYIRPKTMTVFVTHCPLFAVLQDVYQNIYYSLSALV